MSLEKAIESGKEHRKPYYRSKRFDRTCRPGGSCPYCYANRMHSRKVAERNAELAIKEYEMDQNVMAALFPEFAARRQKGLCPTCGDQPGEFKDELSLREFRISGLCQKCQDATFRDPDLDDLWDDTHGESGVEELRRQLS